MHKIYTTDELESLVDNFLLLPGDGEVERLEYKDANDNFPTKDLGKYFSALSNEANLHNQEYGRLIFGIQDKTKNIIGTDYKKDYDSLHALKHSIRQNCNLTFVQIYELTKNGKRLVIFQIPPAIPGIITEHDGHAWGRDGQSLVALNEYKRDTIKSQKIDQDWTASIMEQCTINDIDPDALSHARQGYKRKHPLLLDQVDHWDVMTFLSKARMLRDGKITRACMLLLGKDESLSQYFPRLEMSWILKDLGGTVLTNQNFKAPFLIAANTIISLIRQVPQRLLPTGSLLPIDIIPYDDRVLRELIANAICHQDYTKQGRIGLQEFPGHLVLSNPGSFFTNTTFEDIALQEDFMPSTYRNPFLKDAMSEIKMIEYAGSGIRKIYQKQKEKFMPMPELIESSDTVKIRLEGKIINQDYAKLLYKDPTITLSDTILLDKIQKNKTIDNNQSKQLKSKGLVEGRYPHIHISLGIAQELDQVGDYIMLKANIDEQRTKIYNFIKRHKDGVNNEKIFAFVTANKLFEQSLSEKEMKTRLQNILTYLKTDQTRTIYKIGSTTNSKWFIHKEQIKNK